MEGDVVFIRKIESGWKNSSRRVICSPAYVPVEVVGLFASMELGSKPARVEISTAESEVLGIVVIKFHISSSKCFHISITLQGHRSTIGLVTVTDMGLSAEDDD